MTHHKSEDYKEQAVRYYLVEDNTQKKFVEYLNVLVVV
jgi:hypothetical protein